MLILTQIWKYLGQVFAYPFSNIKKSYLPIRKYLRQFFAHTLFKYLKKAYLWIWKYLGQLFAYTLFKYLKNIFSNLKIPRTIFCFYPFQILWILKAPLFTPISIYIKTLIQIILIKTIIQINKHKAKYIITACIPIIIIKKFLFFI